jgi:hypothetical protein
VVRGQEFRALARRDDGEPRGSAPVDHLADQRRLVAVRERVNDARIVRAAGEQGPCERVGFDVHHDDVLAVLAARERVADPGSGVAGRVDHDRDLGCGNQRLRVVGDERRAALRGLRERRRRPTLRGPSAARERGTRAIGREVGDRDDVDAGRVLRLREVHRAELSCADQADGERTPLGCAG